MTREDIDRIASEYFDDKESEHEMDEVFDLAKRTLEKQMQETCEDVISRARVVEWLHNCTDDSIEHAIDSNIEFIPSVNPQPKIGHWTEYDHGLGTKYYQCSVCKGFDSGEKGKYCRWCGSYNGKESRNEVNH